MSIKGFEVGGVQERYDYTALDNTPANLVQDANYVHTDNNFTNADKTKLDGIATGANKTIIDATLTQSGQAADAKAVGDKINDLKSAFTANLIHDTATGSIANFPDGAALPVRDLTVDIEPVQDLHGYDNPWPAGGGKNLFADSVKSGTNNGVTFSYDGQGRVTIKRVSTSTAGAAFPTVADFPTYHQQLDAGTYTLSFTRFSGSGEVVAQIYDDAVNLVALCAEGSSATFTLSEAKYVTARGLVAANVSPDGVWGIQIEKGSSATSFQPYSNICPISGWTGATVTRTGKNLANINANRNGYGVDIKFVGSTITLTGTATETNAQAWISDGFILPAGTYTFSHDNDDRCAILVGGWGVSFSVPSSTPKTFSITVPTKISYGPQLTSGTSYNKVVHVQLELNSTATAYEPYQGETYTITFPSEAGTVYGGTLDVTKGKLTVDRVKEKKQWGSSQYQTVIGTVARKEITLSSVAVYPPTTGKPQLSSIAPYKAAYFEDSVHFYINGNSTNQLIIFLPVGTSDDTEFEVSYELATPIEYTLTPTEVTTLIGTNNVWADTGDTTVDYYADPTLYINRKIAAAVAAMS